MRPRFGSCVIKRRAAIESRRGGSGHPPLRKTPNASSLRVLASSDAVTPPLLPQRLAADAEDGRGARLLARHLVQHVADVFLLDLLQRRPSVASRPEGGRLLEDVRGQ